MTLCLHFRKTPRELNELLTVAEAIEFQAFARHETLDPVSWEQTAHIIRTILAGIPREEGKSLPEIEELTPTIPWEQP